nr:plasmid replication initiator TrfA [uncultured Ralstonia sp.]
MQARVATEALSGGQLPLFPEEDTSALPNYIARTPLFAPIQRGRRKMHDDAVLPSPEGCEVRFTGKQLDMADQDVFMLALKYAQGVDLNQPVRCDRAEFLRDLGWKPGKNGAFGTSAYAWLDQSFKRLANRSGKGEVHPCHGRRSL